MRHGNPEPKVPDKPPNAVKQKWCQDSVGTDAEAVGLQLASRRGVERRKMLGNGAAGEIWVHQGSTRWGPRGKDGALQCAKPHTRRTCLEADNTLFGRTHPGSPATSESDPSSTSNRTSKNPAQKHLQWVRSKHRHFDGVSTEGRHTYHRNVVLPSADYPVLFSARSQSCNNTADRINASTPQLLGYA